jgi:hypothetical protein
MRDNGTQITAVSSGASPMFSLCSSSCSGVGVEGIFFNGAGMSITGIENDYAGSESYVDHVNLSNFGSNSLVGLGLKVTASDSGPYSNISCGSTFGNTECVNINASNTKGLHGITCTDSYSSGSAYPAILLDGANNTVEDVHIEGFSDGILVGSAASAQSNVLSSVKRDPHQLFKHRNRSNDSRSCVTRVGH